MSTMNKKSLRDLNELAGERELEEENLVGGNVFAVKLGPLERGPTHEPVESPVDVRALQSVFD